MKTLLDKTRYVNRMLAHTAREVDFSEITRVLMDVLESNVYLLDGEGRVLGYALKDDFDCRVVKDELLTNKEFPQAYNQNLLRYGETAANIEESRGICVFKDGTPCIYRSKVTTVVPVVGGGQRLGTLVLARTQGRFSEEDLVLAEHAAAIVALEMLRYAGQAREEEARQRAAVQVALGTLSFSELNAVKHVFAELKGEEGFLVASKVADRVGITRSVIVNALRKFESAGVIESRSLGMKGTYIRVLNPLLLEELRKLR
ncbi:MAG: GTP-sensing pleiotropic transcriptional regulator CodY [Firmicutes bacterium]|nr:GTP-sensing pleiotropic transcriptional regulator CodY [Candidatus Fermentithermobacillaceae bacterium]